MVIWENLQAKLKSMHFEHDYVWMLFGCLLWIMYYVQCCTITSFSWSQIVNRKHIYFNICICFHFPISSFFLSPLYRFSFNITIKLFVKHLPLQHFLLIHTYIHKCIFFLITKLLRIQFIRKHTGLLLRHMQLYKGVDEETFPSCVYLYNNDTSIFILIFCQVFSWNYIRDSQERLFRKYCFRNKKVYGAGYCDPCKYFILHWKVNSPQL